MNYRHYCASTLLTLGCALAMIGCATATPIGATVPEDIERVAQVRRQLRAACGQLRQAGDDAKAKSTLLGEAADTTRLALIGWQQIRKDTPSSPPPAYAAHPQWDQASAEIEKGIVQMLALAEQSQPVESFQACGQTCGLFVKLNTQAGVRRTSDVLFHFRKAAKPLAQPAKSGERAPLAQALPALLELRHRAMVDPIGGVASAETQQLALQAFSNAVDHFAAAVQDRQMDVANAYAAMMRAMEKAYDAYL